MSATSSQTSRARGWVLKRGAKYEARWYDETGKRRSKKGFTRKGDAQDHLLGVIAEVQQIRSGEIATHRPETVNDLLDLFLHQHGPTVDPATFGTMETQLKHARRAFGHRDPETLRRAEIKAWRLTLSQGMRHYAFRSFRQALTWAATDDPPLLSRNPSDGIKNPKRKRHERRPVVTFEWPEIEAITAQLSPVYAALIVVTGALALRPEEAFGLHRSDIEYADALGGDRGVIRIQRRFTRGTLKLGTKTVSSRPVPFGERVERALRSLPPRIDTPILFPTPRGHYIDNDAFRNRVWLPALRAAGLGHHRLYDLRHTGISMMLAVMSPAKVALLTGTSIAQLDATYSHLLKSDGHLGAALDRFIGQSVGE
jgi:integrase